MYESMTYEVILQRMLERVREKYPDLDTREGSVIYDALAPAAVELTNAYIEADIILNESFADTASRYYLIKRAAERGLIPYSATYAVVKGRFTPSDLPIPIGARFSFDSQIYAVSEKIEDGVYQLTCETAGESGNQGVGNLVPVDYISGLETAELTELLIPGEEEEETEAFRQRYFSNLNAQTFGGNVADYQETVNALQGVGGVKVFPVWDGGGTVKLVLLSSQYSKPSQELLDFVKNEMDPAPQEGTGVGLAPIGHVVTVVGVAEVPVNLSMQVTCQDGWSWEDLRSQAEAVLEEYFLELRKAWADQEELVVRVSQIETRMLGITGVLDITGTTINGQAQNLVLDAEQIPVRGDVHGEGN